MRKYRREHSIIHLDGIKPYIVLFCCGLYFLRMCFYEITVYFTSYYAVLCQRGSL